MSKVEGTKTSVMKQEQQEQFWEPRKNVEFNIDM